MHKQTIKNIDLKNKTVLASVDYNVPFDTDGSIEDLYRLRASLPTLRYLLRQNCRLILISHLGRPGGKPDPKFSLRPVAAELAELLNHRVTFVDECIGHKPRDAIRGMRPREILLLENLRFHAEEEANDPTFAKELAGHGQLFVQDAFGNAHREHASLVGIPKYLPAVAGLLLEKEVTTITRILEHPRRPLLAIIGGAKVEGKIDLIDNLVKKVDQIVIGGAMANTFFLDQHFRLPIGKSVHEEHMKTAISRIISAIKDKFDLEGEDLTKALKDFLVLPEDDVAVAKQVAESAPRWEIATKDVSADDIIVDFGAVSTSRVIRLVHAAGTVIWNGPLGVTEIEQFAKSSVAIARAIADTAAESLLAGGDTAAFVAEFKLLHRFNHVSTGGGAALELMAAKSLPAVEALLDKENGE